MAFPIKLFHFMSNFGLLDNFLMDPKSIALLHLVMTTPQIEVATSFTQTIALKVNQPKRKRVSLPLHII